MAVDVPVQHDDAASLMTTDATASEHPLAVETRSLRKAYRRTIAVADLSLSVRQGEIFGFLGPNGAGKTTSVKMLMGLIRPTSGTARLLGRPLGDREAKRKIGFLPELFRFHDWLSGEELLDFHGKLYGMSERERQRRIPEVLELVGLADRRKDLVRSYSKGMQQRAGLAQALLNDPSVVFLDEPTSALDPMGRLEVRNIIRGLRDAGKTVFLNSHLLSEVEMVCDRVAIIHRGQVAATGPVHDLVRHDLTVELVIGASGTGVESILEPHGVVREIEAAAAGRTMARLAVNDDDAIAHAVDDLVRAGIPVYAVTPHGRSLEELFFEVVSASEQERAR
ncbi:MAG TPA: ABC transporter ATP-binding protein [Thermomicrobiales bacterium]|nr:ABC transporter ATP-binding protein [Thermomicrobiales bacterium]